MLKNLHTFGCLFWQTSKEQFLFWHISFMWCFLHCIPNLQYPLWLCLQTPSIFSIFTFYLNYKNYCWTITEEMLLVGLVGGRNVTHQSRGGEVEEFCLLPKPPWRPKWASSRQGRRSVMCTAVWSSFERSTKAWCTSPSSSLSPKSPDRAPGASPTPPNYPRQGAPTSRGCQHQGAWLLLLLGGPC